MKTKLVVVFIALLVCYSSLIFGQTAHFIPQKIVLSDTILENSIKKYQRNITEREIMVVSRESVSDTVKYFMSAISSAYKLSKNIPSAYTQIRNKNILLYTGLEQMAAISSVERDRFVSQFKGLLDNDILPDGKTRNPRFIGTYDPIQCLIIIKDGKKVYEDFKKGFGPKGIPYLTGK